MQYVEFEISDIDQAGDRVDSLIVTANGGRITPRLQVMSPDPTVRVYGNTATALGVNSGRSMSGSAFGQENNGNIKVIFQQKLIDSVTITYFEASESLNPSARGIGLFGGLLMVPAKLLPSRLLKFGVALNDYCQPVVRWVSSQEFGLREYQIEYSYDGYNFSHAGSYRH